MEGAALVVEALDVALLQTLLSLSVALCHYLSLLSEEALCVPRAPLQVEPGVVVPTTVPTGSPPEQLRNRCATLEHLIEFHFASAPRFHGPWPLQVPMPVLWRVSSARPLDRWGWGGL